MKKKILAVGVCMTMALTALCACNAGNGKNGAALSKPNDVYGMGAVSTVKLLGGETSAKAISRLSAARYAVTDVGAAGTESDVKAQALKFNEYFTALDSFMGEEIVTTESESNTDERYPYETKLTIKSKDLNGGAVQNVMYFTETFIGTKTEDDETESRYTLTGVLVVDGVDYYMEGGRTVEQEDDESEHELKIRAYGDKSDRTSYIEMAQEYSEESDETETEYVYSIYTNGILVEQTAVEFERESGNGKEEIEYELEFRKGGAKGKYVVERETENGKVQIKVKYNIGGKQGKFRIRETTNVNGDKHYEYIFDDSTELKF